MMTGTREIQNADSSSARQTAQQPLRRWPAGVFYLAFLSLATSFCQESPQAIPAFSILWHPQHCLSLSPALHPASVPLVGAPSLPNCSELARLVPLSSLTEVTESSSADARSDERFIEAIPPNSNAFTGEEKTPAVQWKPLMNESSFYLGVMHGFRFATEPSTQKAMGNKPFGYFAALGAMHGWSDGDTYYENYLGHPIEGAVSDYLWIHNDLRYRNVEFGKSRDYWMSRLRAYAYAWAFSEQFEIGLFSEASLGQIQRYCCAYGFVDHIITPNFGLIWLLGGDVLDRYVTRPLENRTRSRNARILLRAAINPPQTFANVLMLQYPWHRENRPSPTLYDGQLYLRPESPNSGKFALPIVPKFELTAAMPSYMQMGHYSCLGGSGVAGFRLGDFWQWTAEVGGCTLGNSLPSHWSGDSLIFNTGPQWIVHNSGRWSPHMHFRLGGQKVTQEYCAVPTPQPGGLSAGKPCTSEPNHYVQHYESTGLSISTGGGLDVKLNNALALRIANLDYMYSWLHPVAGNDYNQGVRFTSGLVLRIGTW